MTNEQEPLEPLAGRELLAVAAANGRALAFVGEEVSRRIYLFECTRIEPGRAVSLCGRAGSPIEGVRADAIPHTIAWSVAQAVQLWRAPSCDVHVASPAVDTVALRSLVDECVEGRCDVQILSL